MSKIAGWHPRVCAIARLIHQHPPWEAASSSVPLAYLTVSSPRMFRGHHHSSWSGKEIWSNITCNASGFHSLLSWSPSTRSPGSKGCDLSTPTGLYYLQLTVVLLRTVGQEDDLCWKPSKKHDPENKMLKVQHVLRAALQKWQVVTGLNPEIAGYFKNKCPVWVPPSLSVFQWCWMSEDREHLRF